MNVDAVRLRKNGIARANIERSRHGSAAENEKPSLAFRLQTPRGIWRKIELFEDEIWTGNQNRPFWGEPVLVHLKFSRSGIRDRDGIFNMKYTLATVIEYTECHITALLEFRDDEARANCVNRSSGNENDVARRYGLPHEIEPSSMVLRNCRDVSR